MSKWTYVWNTAKDPSALEKRREKKKRKELILEANFLMASCSDFASSIFSSSISVPNELVFAIPYSDEPFGKQP